MTAGTGRGEPDHLLGRKQMLRQESVKTLVINLADECPHGADHSMTARRTPRKIDVATGPDAGSPYLTRRVPGRPDRGGP